MLGAQRLQDLARFLVGPRVQDEGVFLVRAENRPGIVVYSPDGVELAYIKTEIPTNVGFGRGKDASLLYITAGSSLYCIRVNREGYHLPMVH